MAQGIGISIFIFVMLVFWICFRPSMKVNDKKELGVRYASPVYSDEKGAKLLTASELNLQGKPDFIFKTWILKRYIPLEIKSAKIEAEMPHLGDLYQLAAYFLIIEAVYGKRPPYGKLVYANKTFTIRNTAKLRKQTKKIIDNMQGMLDKTYKPKAQPSFTKCKNCMCQRTVCKFYEGE